MAESASLLILPACKDHDETKGVSLRRTRA